MRRLSTWAAAVVLASVVGCGGGPAGSGGGGGKAAKDPLTGKALQDSKGNAVSIAAANKFKEGLDAMTRYEKSSWNEAACKSTADLFLAAASEHSGPTFGEAHYNAGVAYQRCKKTSDAKEQFQKALSSDSKFHRARVQLALYAFAESGERNTEQAISEIRQAAIVDAQFKNVEALGHLGMLYLRRNNSVADSDGNSDLSRAKKYAQSALAVDDGYMPALNLLALVYFEAARQKAGRGAGKRVATNLAKEKKVDSQAMELAALVCSQAVRKNPNYAPIHNTAGMIQVELGNLNNAVTEFNIARKLEPEFYEAQMNYAAVNLQFRGFKPAEDAYRIALRMRPNDYEARLGLALALRGQIDDANFDRMVAAAAQELEAAKKLAPERAETYYNDAILTQEYKAKSGGAGAKPALQNAKRLFGEFIQKAGSSAEFADAVKRSKERMEEIDIIIKFNDQGEAERKAAQEDLRQKQAEAAAAAKAKEEGEEPAKGGAAPPP